MHQRAELLYQQLDSLQALRRQAKQALLAESRKHAVCPILRKVPGLGPIRVALLIALVQTPFRFRSKRQFWAYAGLALVVHISAEYRIVDGQIERRAKHGALRGLNFNYNHDLKQIFKGAALAVSSRPGPWRDWFVLHVAQGQKPELVRLTVARKLAALTLALWKKGERYDAHRVMVQAA